MCRQGQEPIARHLLHLVFFFPFDGATTHGFLDGPHVAAGAPTGKRPLPAQHKTSFPNIHAHTSKKTPSFSKPRDQKRPQGPTHKPPMALLLNGTWQPHYNLCISFLHQNVCLREETKKRWRALYFQKSVTMNQCTCLGEGSMQEAADHACTRKKKKKKGNKKSMCQRHSAGKFYVPNILMKL